MNKALVHLYNEELAYLREAGAAFAARFPKVGGRLGMQGIEVADPHVERLLEGAAFLSARVRLKLDAEFPRFTRRLLELLHPGYLAPTPAMAIARFFPLRGHPALATGHRIPRGTPLYTREAGSRATSAGAALQPSRPARCEFRTAHAVELHPFEIAGVRHEPAAGELHEGDAGEGAPSRASLRITLATTAGRALGESCVDQLEFHLSGPDDVACRLHAAITAGAGGVTLIDQDGARRRLPRSAAEPSGLDEHEALLPAGERDLAGVRLLREYFAFPQRFLFFRVRGLGEAWRRLKGQRAELIVHLPEADPILDARVDASSLALFCTPVVNLFSRRGERILVDPARHRHRVVVDRTRPRDFEVFDVASVTAFGPGREQGETLHSLHAARTSEIGGAPRYFTDREPRLAAPSGSGDPGPTGHAGSDVFVSLVDAREAPSSGDIRQLGLRLNCTNGDLPHLVRTDGRDDFTMDDAAPIERIGCLRGPSRARAAAESSTAPWALINQLSLDHLSMIDAEPSTLAARLRAMLSMHADPSDPVALRQIGGIVGVRATPITRRVGGAGPLAFARGVAVELELDETAFEGSGPLMLASVLDRWFAHHVHLNAFVETRVRGTARGELLRWPTRSGTRALL